jgi:ATP-dependent HslUV protease subunit HslV
MLIVADVHTTLLLSGTGDLIEPDDGVAGIGSGSVAAIAAARALLSHTDLPPAAVVGEALAIAASLDLYTNDALTIEEL